MLGLRSASVNVVAVAPRRATSSPPHGTVVAVDPSVRRIMTPPYAFSAGRTQVSTTVDAVVFVTLSDVTGSTGVAGLATWASLTAAWDAVAAADAGCVGMSGVTSAAAGTTMVPARGLRVVVGERPWRCESWDLLDGFVLPNGLRRCGRIRQG